jgi:mannitol/fructose-specific phosphotransferase system IIA component
MKIGEALLERDHLSSRLGALEARLSDDLTHGRPVTHVVDEIDQTSTRILALQDAVSWTTQHLLVEDVALGSYINKSEHYQRVADLLEKVSSPDLRERIDELHEAKKSTDVLIQTIYWAYDLQIPGQEVSTEPEEEN